MDAEEPGIEERTPPFKRKNNTSRRRGPVWNKRPKAGGDGEPSPSSSASSAGQNKNICFQWAKNGNCDRGDSCRFLHETPFENVSSLSLAGGAAGTRTNDNRGTGATAKTSDVCFQWAKTGFCRRGDSCKFLHPSLSLENENGEQGTNKPKNDSFDMMDIDNTSEHANHSGLNSNKDRNNNKKTRNRNNRKSERGGRQNESENDATLAVVEWEEIGGNDIQEITTTRAHITDQRFEDLSISAESRRALKDVFGYEFMTVVQAETLPVILEGVDCLARAKTGTGKTLAFLIPSVEHLIQNRVSPSSTNDKDDIGCLVISPTRELAFQISKEAENLVMFHKGLAIATVVGGTNIGKDHRALKQNVSIVVATPGRLLDHLQNTAGLVDRLSNLRNLVLDEADQLLDMGFRPDIERILGFLSKSASTRQTLLFSATIPQSVSEISSIALRPSYDFVNTVAEEEEQTHLHVRQESMVVPQADQIHAIASLLLRETSQEPYKVIVFFTTARLTGFMAELFNSIEKKTGFSILEIHSRKSQAARQKASDKFRKSRNAVLFSSDVSARGMDYPDVTAVLQVGLTDRAQYIHRLGRTARAGKSGHGVILMAPYEMDHMTKRELKDLPLQTTKCPPLGSKYKTAVDEALNQVSNDADLQESGEQAYRAWLGYYNGNLKKCKWDKTQLVAEANQWAKDIGLKQQPKLLKKTVGNMQLKGIPGLLVE